MGPFFKLLTGLFTHFVNESTSTYSIAFSVRLVGELHMRHAARDLAPGETQSMLGVFNTTVGATAHDGGIWDLHPSVSLTIPGCLEAFYSLGAGIPSLNRGHTGTSSSHADSG